MPTVQKVFMLAFWWAFVFSMLAIVTKRKIYFFIAGFTVGVAVISFHIYILTP